MKLAAYLSGARAWADTNRAGLVFMAGLALFGAGLAWAWPPLGLIGPGVVLMAVAIIGGGRSNVTD